MQPQLVEPTAPSAAPFYRSPQNHAETFWTPERDSELRRLYATGLSATAIQKEIGASSRGRVCGRINRLGLTRDIGYEVTRARLRAEREAKLAAGMIRAKGGSVKAVRVGKAKFKVLDFRRPGPDGFVGALIDDYVPRTAPDVPVEQRKTFAEVLNHHCHWPFNDPREPDFYYCGDPSADLLAGRPYCEFHAAMSRPNSGTPTQTKQES